LLVDESDWEPAVDGNGEDRAGVWIAELTDLVDLSAWPPGTRLALRRERPHPGAQLTLFDTVDGYRHRALITYQTGHPVTLELRHLQRACVEQVIRDAKACGLDNLPSADAVNNQIWCQLVTAAVNLLAGAKRLTSPGDSGKQPPRRSATGSSTSPPGSAPPSRPGHQLALDTLPPRRPRPAPHPHRTTRRHSLRGCMSPL
jgi:hypothetical protein